MAQKFDSDPVVASVAAYSTDPEGYERHYAEHLLDRPARFASQFSHSAHILDVGCGPGRDLQVFSAAGHSPIGIDLNPSFVEMARRHGEVITGDIREVSTFFPPATFEGVWAQASLVHLSTVEVERVLNDFCSLLIAGGRLYACVPASGTTGWRDESDGRRWYTSWPDESFVTAVASAGFNIDSTTNGVYVEVWATKR
jgi:SAM-dependent methyltransferase